MESPSSSRQVAARFEQASALHRQGRLQDAEALYRLLLTDMPTHHEALHMLGVARLQQGQLRDGIELIQRSLAISPDARACLNLGRALLDANRPADALTSLDHALRLRPQSADAWNGRGNALLSLQRYDEALASYDRALALQADFLLALNNRGAALRLLHRADEALASHERALRLAPADIDALNGRGKSLLALNRPEEAAASFSQALELRPQHAESSYNRGTALLRLARWPEALADFDHSLKLRPTLVEAWVGRGTVQLEMHGAHEALASFQEAVRLRPSHLPALHGLGNAQLRLKQPDQALTQFDAALRIDPKSIEALNGRGGALLALARPREALDCFDQALALAPDTAGALNNRGTALSDLDLQQEAADSFQRALRLDPDSVEALSNLSQALRKLKRHEAAARCLEQLLRLVPDADYALGRLLRSCTLACDWSQLHRLQDVPQLIESRRSLVKPFTLLGLMDDPALQLQCARRYVSHEYPAASEPLWRGERYAHERIRVAYLSADFHSHATAFLMAELFERHDRRRFETIAVSFGPDRPDQMRTRLRGAFDQFFEVRTLSGRAIAELLRALEVDIVVDLKGHTFEARPEILAQRAAPVQAAYLGFPATMGAPYVDYLIADREVIPLADQVHYEEKIVYLPHCYQPNDTQRSIAEHTPTREQAGLPAHGFVFCCFNNNYKLTPTFFDIWMRLLTQVPDSVLWLLADNDDAPPNLRREAQRRGIDPQRLVFARRVPLPEHLARHRLADLFLDTLPCNAHTTASDALWAGLPVLTCRGRGFAARVASSLLHTVSMGELVTDTLEDYESLALQLVCDPQRLAKLRAQLAHARTHSPLFDTESLTRQLEAAFHTMWQRAQLGLSPASFAVRER